MKKFTFERLWFEAIAENKRIKPGAVFMAICKYAFYNEAPTNLTPPEKMFFEFVKIYINNQRGQALIEENRKIRSSSEYRAWRNEVLERDAYTCVLCGRDETNSELNVHHIKPFSLYPELRFEVNNGLALCKECHINVHKNRREWEK